MISTPLVRPAVKSRGEHVGSTPGKWRAPVSNFKRKPPEVLKDLNVADLARELKVTPSQAAVYKQEIEAATGVTPASAKRGRSALDLVQEKEKRSGIVTFCKELDELLQGGIPLREVTEICGMPGVGKTQMCMQLAVNVQIPCELGGVEGAAVYVDTEGALNAERLYNIAEALHNHVSALARKCLAGNSAVCAKIGRSCTAAAMLANIHIFRCTDLAEQSACILGLPAFLKAHPEVRIVIVDSLAFHYRYLEADAGARVRHLQCTGQHLNRLATSNDVAVVVVNHMTTRFEPAGVSPPVAPEPAADSAQNLNEGKVEKDVKGLRSFVPALGEAWAPLPTNRLLIETSSDSTLGVPLRNARLLKCLGRSLGVAPFGISDEGIRTEKMLHAHEVNSEELPPPLPQLSGSKRPFPDPSGTG